MDISGSDEPVRCREDMLVERFRLGERQAFDELYELYKARIYNYVKKMIGNAETAKELTQEVFVNVFMNIENYKAKGFFKAWIYTIAANLCRNEWKRQSHRNEVSLSEPVIKEESAGVALEDLLGSDKFSPEQAASNAELTEAITAILGSLPPKYREAMVLCVMEGLSYEEAARVLGTNVKTVSSRLARAREIFIKRIKAMRGGTGL